MRALWLALLTALLLAGCGETNNNGTVNTFPTQNPQTNTLLLDQANAVAAAQVISRTILVTGSLNQSQVSGGNLLQFADSSHPASFMSDLMANFPAFAQGGSRVVNGTRGGTVNITVDSANSAVGLVFSTFQVANTTLTGAVNMTGRVTPQGNQVNAVFSQLRVTSAAGAYQIDGPATGVLAQTGNSIQGTFSTEATVADQSGGAVRFRNFSAIVSGTLSGNTINGSQVTNGFLDFQNFRTSNGTVEIRNAQPFAFTADLTPGSTTPPVVSAGQTFYNGNGSVRITVVSPNQVEIAVQPPGAQGFTPVQTISYLQLIQ